MGRLKRNFIRNVRGNNNDIQGQKNFGKALVECNEALDRSIVGVSNSLMDPTRIRMRYLLLILFAALITAAGLRHVLHVNAGFTRLEILEGALACVALSVFLGLALRPRRRD
jgi:hypothetical protein